MNRPLIACLLALATSPLCACKRASESASEPPARTFDAPDDASTASPRPVLLDVVRDLDDCALGHRGVLLDFGSPSMRADLHPGSFARNSDEMVEREGATWLRAHSRHVSASFYWPPVANDTPDSSAYVEARARGVTARAASVMVDGKTVGTWTFAKGEARVVLARASNPLTLAPGGHELAVHFVGGSRSGEEAYAELDWVHVGVGEPGDPYSAPTAADVAVDANLGGRSMRALSLRAPGFVRCSGWIPADATLEASLATAGGGDADVEARVLRDRRPPVVLGAAHVGEGASGWAPWSLPVTGLEGEGALASLELVVKRATKGTRVLLGEPRVVAAGTISPSKPRVMRAAVVVVFGSLSSKELAPWGGPRAVPELSRLASEGTTFVANRATTSLSAGVVASMLTGLPPTGHRVDDPDTRLPEGPTTVEEACREGGIATAMFTANPTTGVAFGFGRGWDTFVERDPLEDVSATRVFDDAAEWIEAHKGSRFLVVVHARGGHPPWEATPEELKTMPPEGYLGIVEPRRAAEALTKVRKHPGRFKEDDRVRAWALYDRAIDAHDAALGRLLGALRAAGRESDTAVIATADVASSEAPPVPFGDSEGLEEALLATPLIVRWPGVEVLAARRVDAPSGPADVARTILATLGLAPPAAFQGVDLAGLALGEVVPTRRPLLATRGARFSLRWGPYVLIGARQRETRMCDLSLDPACIADVRMTSPLALEPVRRWAFDAMTSIQPSAYARVPAVLDEHTLAALVRWGRPVDDREKEEP